MILGHTKSQKLKSCNIKILKNKSRKKIKKFFLVRHQWFIPVILATEEAEIRKIEA
jgi:hypothetical protein